MADLDNVDETLLVRRSKQGDQQAYAQLVLRYRKRIYSMLLRFVRNSEDAENLCQETFLKAYLALSTFEERASFLTWIHRIAVNLGLNYSERRKRIVPWDANVHENLLQTESMAEGMEQDEELAKLRAAIDLLPPKQKAAVLLRDYEGLSFAEIAESLDCPIGTAKANHFHALKNLRKKLVEEVPGGGK